MNTRKQMYTLTLTDAGHRLPVYSRMKRLLKAALRVYGFRCLSIREVKPGRLWTLDNSSRRYPDVFRGTPVTTFSPPGRELAEAACDSAARSSCVPGPSRSSAAFTNEDIRATVDGPSRPRDAGRR